MHANDCMQQNNLAMHDCIQLNYSEIFCDADINKARFIIIVYTLYEICNKKYSLI